MLVLEILKYSMTSHLEVFVSCIDMSPIMTSEFLVLPSVNPEDLISGSNSGLRVVGGFHKSLEQQKTVPPKSHPFSGVKSDQLVYWSFKLG